VLWNESSPPPIGVSGTCAQIRPGGRREARQQTSLVRPVRDRNQLARVPVSRRLTDRQKENHVTDTVTLAGVVATKPENVRTSTGLTVTNFRLASSQRRFDRATSTWVEGDTNWYTVNAYRWMANNVANSLEIGNHVVLTGRLRVRNWTSGDKRGTAVEVDVDAIGHDLAFGVSHFTRLKAAVPAEQAGVSSADESGGFDPLSSGQQASGGDAWSIPGVEDDGASSNDRSEAVSDEEPTGIDSATSEPKSSEKVPF
jgi:single-strand DNA-binding protein